MKYPQTILNLIECFKKLPGIGEKSAERMALSTLNMDEEILTLFSNTLLDIPKKIKHCKQCNNLCEGDLCAFHQRGNLGQDGGTAYPRRNTCEGGDCLPDTRRVACRLS